MKPTYKDLAPPIAYHLARERVHTLSAGVFLHRARAALSDHIWAEFLTSLNLTPDEAQKRMDAAAVWEPNTSLRTGSTSAPAASPRTGLSLDSISSLNALSPSSAPGAGSSGGR